jgi:group I intron endonuclease
MSTSIYNGNYRKNLITHWRQFYPDWDIPTGYHVHHIKPKALGGTHQPKNLIALHPDDHVSIHRCRGDKINDKFILVARRHGKNHPMYGKKHSEETRLKMKEVHKDITGKNNPMYGKKHSEETKKKLSKQKTGKNHPFYGKTRPEETKQKMKQNHKDNSGKNHPFFSGYYITPFGKFASSYEQNEIGTNNLINYCKNNNKIISSRSYALSPYLNTNYPRSIIGKTFKDLVFDFHPR